MRILISGASGFIGGYLARFLMQQKHEVIRLVRRTDAGPGEVAWDPDHGRLDPAAFYGVDVVVNLSGADIGAQRWTADYKHTILVSRMRATELLAETMAGLRERKPDLFISASAVGWYGHREPDEVLTEDSSPGAGFIAEVTRKWEIAAEPARRAGIAVLHPRLGVVLGPGGALARLLPPFRSGLGGRLGSGRQVFSWIALDDIGPALLHAVAQRFDGAVNFTAPGPVTNAQLGRLLGAVLHKPVFTAVPPFALRMMLGEMADELLAGQRVMPRCLLDSGYQFRYPDLQQALEKYVPEL